VNIQYVWRLSSGTVSSICLSEERKSGQPYSMLNDLAGDRLAACVHLKRPQELNPGVQKIPVDTIAYVTDVHLDMRYVFFRKGRMTR